MGAVRASRRRAALVVLASLFAAALMWGIPSAFAADESATPAAQDKVILRLGWTNDPDKARAALDAAGYADSDGNGVREYKGKDITLRLYARSEAVEEQNSGKLIAGWFKDVGLDIKYEVIDDGALGDKQFNYQGDDFAPDFDMFIWGWGVDVDPNFVLSIFLTSQIENWSDCNWSDKEYDGLFLEQQSQIDVQERIATVHRMEQILYEESPYIVLVYPVDLQAANTADWTGWVRAGEGGGLWWYNNHMDTYLALHPAAVETEQAGGRAGLIVGIVIAAVVVAAVVVVLVRRGRARAELEG